MIASSKGSRLLSLLLSLEKRLFHGYETAERLHLLNGRPGGGSIGKQLRFRLTRHNYEMARTEARLIDFGRHASAVMVGCGIFPATLISLAENTGLPNLLGIDHDPKVVELAQALIAHTGHRISFACHAGESFDFSPFDLIYIANGSEGKSRVLARAAATGPADCEIVVRFPIGPGRLFYEDLDLAPPAGLKLSRVGKPDYFFLNRVAIFTKEQEARKCREMRPSIAS